VALAGSAFVWLNDVRNRIRPRRFAANRVLLLLPHCLQRQDCPHPVKDNIANCQECGRCKMKEIKQLAARFGVKVHVASGGREAVDRATAKDVDVVLAVACNKELAEGIQALFPKRVVGVLNQWPNGPCKDTDVDMTALERALESVVKGGRKA
jgi:hypothetical protein